MKMLLSIGVLLLAGCGDSSQPPANLMQHQVEAMDKARAVEDTLQDSFRSRDRELREQNR